MADNYDPTAPVRNIGIESDWPKSSMTTTTVERLEQQARLQSQQPQPNRLSEMQLRDVTIGAHTGREGR